jgi:hypothetical protein
MDQRIESFLGDVLALAGEEPDAVPEGVRRALAKCEVIFRLQEPKKRMRDQAAHACRALCRSRSRGVAAPQGNAHRRALEAGAQHHRPAAGALSLARTPLPAALVDRGAGGCFARVGREPVAYQSRTTYFYKCQLSTPSAAAAAELWRRSADLADMRE